MKFKTKFLTNIVYAGSIASVVFIVSCYFAFEVIYRLSSEFLLWVFLAPAGLSMAIGGAFFFYRTLLQPKSLEFCGRELIVEYLFLEMRRISIDSITGYDSTSPSDGSSNYTFRTIDGAAFSVMVESYEVWRMTKALKECGLFGLEKDELVVRPELVDASLSEDESIELQNTPSRELLAEYKRHLRMDFLFCYLSVFVYLVFRNLAGLAFTKVVEKRDHPKKARIKVIKQRLSAVEKKQVYLYFCFQYAVLIFGVPLLFCGAVFVVEGVLPLALVLFAGFVSLMASVGFIAAYYAIIEGQDFKY